MDRSFAGIFMALCVIFSAATASAIELGEYFDPDGDGTIVFETRNSGRVYAGGDEIQFRYVEKDGRIRFAPGVSMLPDSLRIVDERTLAFDEGKVIYHASIAFPLQPFFVHDTFGQTIAYFETAVGPAKRVYADMREYVAGGCPFFVVGKESIEAIGIEKFTANRCAVSIGGLFNSEGGELANSMNFGEFDEYYFKCVYLCGTAVTPTIYGISRGAHANGFIDAVVKIEANENNSRRFESLANSIIELRGEDYLSEGKETADMAVDEVIRRVFELAVPTGVMTGPNLCPGKIFF
jgi:hypothetical protein